MWKTKNDRNVVLTNAERMLFLIGSLDATLLDREANRSLTTDTMCQNLFDPIEASSIDGTLSNLSD